MEISKNEGYGIVSIDVYGINTTELRQMHTLKERVAHVLNTHKQQNEKKEYLTDDELLLMHAILHVFTREYSLNLKSAFDDALEELKNS